MGYKAYPDYKESGVEWFRAIPSDWTVHRLKMLASEPLKYGANEAADLEDPSLPRFIRITDVNSDGSLNPDTFRSLPEKTAEPYLLEDGDILLARSGATVGKSFIYSPEWGKAAYAGYLIRLRTDKHILHKRFAYYFFQSSPYWANIDSELIQATIQNFSAEKYSVICIPTPRIDDQVAITQFLDHKTAQIDRLIEKKQELIEKLQEERITIITQAVTKGLDEGVVMKDSGIECLGAIPAHWKVAALRRFTTKMEQGWSPSCDDRLAAPDEWAVLKSGCVNDGIFRESEHKTMPQELDPPLELEVRSGDVLMCRASGSRHLIGSVAIVSKCREKLIFSDKTYRITVDQDSLNPEFFAAAMHSKYMREQIELSISGAEGLANNIPQSLVKSYIFAAPTLEEQKHIIESLKVFSQKTELQEQAINEAIARLQEYRTALITAAVTGQIDVRDWQAAVPAKEPQADMEVA